MKKKEHMKIMNKASIKVFFKDGKVDEIPSRIWDDYEYYEGMFIVKRRRVWIGIYNMDVVSCVVVGDN